MFFFNNFPFGQVCNRASHFDNTVISAHRKRIFFKQGFQRPPRTGRHRALFDQRTGHSSVKRTAGSSEPLLLHLPSLVHTFFNFCRSFCRRPVFQVGNRHRGQFDLNVNPVKQRAGNPADIFGNLTGYISAKDARNFRTDRDS